MKQVLSVREVKGGQLFFINGQLQFDTRDEALYHEFLGTLPALLLKQRRNNIPIKVLVLGGGDGFILREVFTHSPVKSAVLVDYDAQVIELAKNHFKKWNRGVFYDPRVQVLIEDAHSFLESNLESNLKSKSHKESYDLIIADFTYPESLEGASLYTKSFFLKIRNCLADDGLFATNALSPSKTPRAFRGILKTLKESDFSCLPLEVHIPSFIGSSYGSWGFVINSPKDISSKEILKLDIPSSPYLKFLKKDLFLKARQSLQKEQFLSSGFSSPLIYPLDLLSLISLDNELQVDEETLYRKMLFSLSHLDWTCLLKEISYYGKNLPDSWLYELERMRKNTSAHLNKEFSGKALSSLFLLLTLLNSLNPDYAFAKGYIGSYHGSNYHSNSSSNSSSDADSDFNISWLASLEATPFRLHDNLGPVEDSLWNMGGLWQPKKKISIPIEKNQKIEKIKENLFFSLSDNLYLSDSGEVIVSIWDFNYAYKMLGDRLVLFKSTGWDEGDIVTEFPLDDECLKDLQKNSRIQQDVLEETIKQYESWMNWSGMAYGMLEKIMGEKPREVLELEKLKKIQEIFDSLETRFFNSSAPTSKIENKQKLVPGIFLTKEGRIEIQNLKNQKGQGQVEGEWDPQLKRKLTPFIVKVINHYKTSKKLDAFKMQQFERLLKEFEEGTKI